jgi:hypothetical protein
MATSRAQALISSVAVAAFLTASTMALADANEPAQADNYDATGLAMAADFVIARPLGLVATLVGATIFLAALPFEAMSGTVDEGADYLVTQPAKYTFTRPLGQLEPTP